MAQTTMYPGFVNSPTTTLTAGITDSDVTIPVAELGVFPAAPNIATIGAGSTAETIYYGAKSAASGAGNLTSVTREWNKTGTYGAKKAWVLGDIIGRNFTEYDHASLLTNVTPIYARGIDMQYATLSKDNNGVERTFFKDDFSNNTIANYTLTGSAATIAAGIMSVPATGVAYHTITAGTTGKWEGVVEFTESGAGTAKLLLGDAGTSYVIVTRIVTTNRIWLELFIGGVSKIANTDTTVTLADSTFATVSAVYDGTSWQMYWAGVAVGANTAAITVTTPIIGVAAGTIAGAWGELTFIPSTAFQDLMGADTETRYMQLASTDITQPASTGTWAASAAGDVVISGGYMTVASDNDEAEAVVLRSYNFASGEIEFSLDVNNADVNQIEHTGLLFGYQDILNHYKLVIIDNQAGTETLQFYKVVAGVATALGSAGAIAAYTRGNKTWIKVHIDVQRGQMWAYLRDDAGVYPTTPDVSDAFSSQFSYGKVGFWSSVAAVGAGNISVRFDDLTIRANLLIGETNVPTTETGFYFRDEFTTDSILRYTTTGVWTGTGGLLSCTTAGNCTLPFQTTIGVHTFTPTLANGTDYYYFGGYRIKFVASGGNQCLVTLETTAGVAQGTGSLTVTTTAGLFGAPIVITETASAITVTVAGSGGTPIVSGTTTSTNAYPKFTVGTATCTFDVYSFAGTRYYMKPMLRGAQVGEYSSSGTTISATRFCDDFNWNTLAEASGDTGSYTWDTTNGRLVAVLASIQKTINVPAGIRFSDGVIEWKATFIGTGNNCHQYVAFRSQSTTIGGAEAAGTTTYWAALYLNALGVSTIRLFRGSTQLQEVVITTCTVGSRHKVKIEAVGSSIKVYYALEGSDYPSTPQISKTDATYSSGYVGISSYMIGAGSSWGLDSFNINALESTSTNGVAVTIGGVPHGGRYDTQEEAYFTWTNATQNGEALVQSRAKSTYPTTANFEYYFINSTDSTAINWDGQSIAYLTPGTTYLDGVARALLRYQDVGDTLKISIRRKDYSDVTYDNQPAVYTDLLSFVPVWGV